MLAGAGAPASGQNRWEKTFQALPNVRITVVNPGGGSVIVHGWDKPRVHAVCIAASPKVEIDCDPVPDTGEAERVHFATHVVDSSATPAERTVSYEIDVPTGAIVNVSNPDGTVAVDRVSGEEWIESINGKITVTDATGPLNLRSLRDIEIVRPTGQLVANTVMGDVRVTGSISRDVRAQTGSGKIIFDGEFMPGGNYVLTSYQGDMDISCPRSNSFELRARTVRGKVDNQLHLVNTRHLPNADETGVIGFQNEGDASVEVKSYSGSIHVRPRS